jgi:N-acetylneuraminic acid mutarotase
MVYGRESHAMVSLNAKYIFAIGSRKYNHSFTCEIYDISSDKWLKINNLNQGRYYCSACAFNKRFVYVIGGINKSGIINTIEKYDSFVTDAKW